MNRFPEIVHFGSLTEVEGRERMFITVIDLYSKSDGRKAVANQMSRKNIYLE